jgi:hypothetical protein
MVFNIDRWKNTVSGFEKITNKLKNGDHFMESSKNSLDKLMHSKRKIQKFAMISAFFAVIFTLGLLATNYRLSDLNKSKVNELMQYQNKIEIDAQASLEIKEELDKAISEITKLKKQIKAEKTITNSLKEKLTNTLSLLAQTREKSIIEKENIQQQSAASDIIPTERNSIGNMQQPLKEPDMSEVSLKETEPLDSNVDDQRLKNSTKTNTNEQEDISTTTQLSTSEPSSKKEDIPASSDGTTVKTITSKTVESSQPKKQTDIPPAKPQERGAIQPSDSISETPIKKNGSNDTSSNDSDSSPELSSSKQAFIDQ